MLKWVLPSILIASLALGTSNASYAQTTWHVDDDCAAPGSGTDLDPFCTIQDGVDASDDGDTILVQVGTYTGTGNRDISLFGKAITLTTSVGPSGTILDIEGSPASIHRGFFLVHGESHETTISGFTITGGYVIGVTDGVGSGGGGAAVYIRDSSPKVSECIMRGNVSATTGNGQFADGRGGAILIDRGSYSVIENCVVVNNTSGKRGGGVMIINDADNSASIRNCLIVGNTSLDSFPGGGIHNSGGTPSITNTLIVNNTAMSGVGGGFYNEQSQPFLAGCILWGNEAIVGPQIGLQGNPTLTIVYSDVQGGLLDVWGLGSISWGPGMIDADPLFVDPVDGDFRLLHGSPCIDAGDNLAVPEGVSTDLDGDPRFLDDPTAPDTGNPDPEAPKLPIVDMGPYEYDPEDCNNNDNPDLDDIKNGASDDCDENAIPDDCEVDCNGNGQVDACDVTQDISDDCNGNVIPDECEPDCNGNGQQDDCDITDGSSEDCDVNGVPDECDPDCNDNGEVDACDIAAGISNDCNGNGIPDECPEESAGPPITQQPVSQEVEVGEFVFFTIEADGVLLEYQWRKDRVDLIDSERIIGTQITTLFIMDVASSDAGEYDCVVTEIFDASCSTSDPATLTVLSTCFADFNGDGVVGPRDLTTILRDWGPCLDPDTCPADLNADAVVGPVDLAQLLGAWGDCP